MAVYVRFLMGDIIEAQRTRCYWDLGKKIRNSTKEQVEILIIRCS